MHLTQAIHRDNALHADGRSIGGAHIFGQKLLREGSRTLRMIRPTVMLSGGPHRLGRREQITGSSGLGFDATWELAFYHSLIGDSEWPETERVC